MASENRVAVLIDCDNVSPKSGRAVMAETAKHGALSIKRAYGDFTSPLHSEGYDGPGSSMRPDRTPHEVRTYSDSDGSMT